MRAPEAVTQDGKHAPGHKEPASGPAVPSPAWESRGLDLKDNGEDDASVGDFTDWDAVDDDEEERLVGDIVDFDDDDDDETEHLVWGFPLGNDVARNYIKDMGYELAGGSDDEDVRAAADPGHADPVKISGMLSGVSAEQQLEFERNGHIVLRGLLDESEVREVALAAQAAFNDRTLDAYRQKLEIHAPEAAPDVRSVSEAQKILAEAGVVVPFLQLFNMHTYSDTVANVAKSAKLGRIAAELLGVPSVRLYQDAVFWKRSGDGQTPWHADLCMAPLDTNHFVTFFCPLRALPAGRHAPSLRFASGSHRDFSLPYWFADELNSMDLSIRYPESGHGELRLGDVTAHHGWTLHSSPAVPEESRGRMALSISYVASDARVLPKAQQQRVHAEDARSFSRWIKKAKAGKPLRNDKVLPIVYES